MVEEINSLTQNIEIKFKTVDAPFEARGKASNVVKNLRDALDQAVYAASWKLTGKSSKHTHFPFGSDPEDFKKAIALNRCSDIPTKLYPILSSFEPYPTGNTYPGGDNALRLLGRISGPNKHQIALIVSMDAKKVSFGFPGGGTMHIKEGLGFVKFPFLKERPHKNELVVLSMPPGSDIEGQLQVHGVFHVAFSYPELRQVPATDFLEYCSRRVSQIVQDLRAEAIVLSP